jgi:hypothetical protein
MIRLLKWALALAALAAVAAFVPVGGHTVLARWRAAKTPGAFVHRAWSEVKQAGGKLLGSEPEPRRAERGQARPAVPGHAAPQSPAPAERHTEADRKALDAIVAERAR